MRFQKEERGFTLIELLIVVAIIGLIAGIIFASLNGARKKARDVSRLANVNLLEKSLEYHYLDNGQYPQISGSNCEGPSYTTSNANWDTLMTQLSDHMNPIDYKDPYPVCIFYINFPTANCDEYPAAEYNIIFGTESKEFDGMDLYNYQPSTGYRYCKYPL